VSTVSVVIPAHNAARWLPEAIESVRGQTFTDWDLVVVDDGSTDDTRAAVERFAGDGRIRYLPQSRQERSAARNHGIEATTAPLVAFLDADDWWHAEKLTRQVAALEAAPEAGLCYTVARFVDDAGRPLELRKPPRPLPGDVFAALVRGNVIVVASVVVRRQCLDRIGLFDTTLPVYGCEDWDLWLRLTRHLPAVLVDDELTLYRRHERNTGWEQILASALAVIDKTYADPDTERRAGVSRETVRALHYLYQAAAVAPDDAGKARELVRQALAEDPRALVGRSGLAAMAALFLPDGAMQALRRLGV
jgi:glycosyltransferase involved in cell wall biosynthesis